MANEIKIYRGGYVPEREVSGGGSTPVQSDVALTGYNLLSYTASTWTNVYTNSSGSTVAIYFSMINNNASATRKVYMRISDSAGTTSVHDIVPETSLDGKSGIENNVALYTVANGQKVQFKADGNLCECVVNIGTITANQAFLTTYTNDTWTDVYNNTSGESKKIKLTSICNPQSTSVSVEMRAVNASNTLVYTMLPSTGLEPQSGLENNNSKFVIANGNKVQFKANAAGAQAFITVVSNV
jgi:hypothetical protein